jgi:hypothetical protein
MEGGEEAQVKNLNSWTSLVLGLPAQRPAGLSVPEHAMVGILSLIESMGIGVDNGAPAVAGRPRAPTARTKARLKDVHWKKSEDEARSKAILKWRALLLTAPALSKIGRELLELLAEGTSDLTVSEFLDDVMARKSPATLEKRANALLAFSFWCAKEGTALLPVCEGAVYSYLKSDIMKKRGATAGASLLGSEPQQGPLRL